MRQCWNTKVFLNGCSQSKKNPRQMTELALPMNTSYLAPGEAVVRIGFRAICPALSGEKFAPREITSDIRIYS
jgi:hypothetical protein